jgi:hypothetical protein
MKGPLPAGHLVPEQPLDVVAWVTVRLHTNGMLSTQGTIGDKAMAVHLLEQGADAVRGMGAKPSIVTPSRDVSVMPSLPTRDMAHIPTAERGEP